MSATPRVWGWLVAGVLAGGAFSLATQFARRVLTPATRPDSGVRVQAIDASASDGEADGAGQVVWLSGPDSDLDGCYSFIFDVETREKQHLAGHARLGPVTNRKRVGPNWWVAREVERIDEGDLRVGARGRITGWWFTDPSEFGVAARKVSLPLPGGVGWGWLIEPKNAKPGRWAVHVHGRGALPQEVLRGVPSFLEAGITNLVVAYRNDPGAPQGARGRYGLGLAESEDVDAAIGWVRAKGAERVTLVGWSMGGTAAVLAAGNGANRDVVDAMVLDSPALDWPGLMRKQAKLAHLPEWIAEVGMLLLRAGWVRGAVSGARGTDISSLSAERLAALIRVPTLIHASAGDTFVPWRGSLRVAQLRSAVVRLHPMRGEHVKLWNVDRRAWEEETKQFLATLE